MLDRHENAASFVFSLSGLCQNINVMCVFGHILSVNQSKNRRKDQKTVAVW